MLDPQACGVNSCRVAESLAGMDNSDWWAAELDVPAELFAMEFVFIDPASGVVDNNKYATRGHNSSLRITNLASFSDDVAERTGICFCCCKDHDGPVLWQSRHFTARRTGVSLYW